jgi:hypothetical protein
MRSEAEGFGLPEQYSLINAVNLDTTTPWLLAKQCMTSISLRDDVQASRCKYEVTKSSPIWFYEPCCRARP